MLEGVGVPFKKMFPEILCFVSAPPNTLKNILGGFYIFEIYLLLSLFSHDTEYPMGTCSMKKYDVYVYIYYLFIYFFRRALQRVRPLGKALWVGHCQPWSPQESCWGPLVVMCLAPLPSPPVPYPTHDTRQDATPNKKKKRKQKRQKETLSPTAKERKKESKKERCVGSWRKNWSNCSFAVVTNEKQIHSFIHSTIQIWFCW